VRQRRLSCIVTETMCLATALTASTASAQYFPPIFDLVDLTAGPADEGFVANGDNTSDHVGTDVDFIGDINNDGYGDMAIGCYRYFQPDDGGVYILFGGPDIGNGNPITLSTDLDGTNGFIIRGSDAYNTEFGTDVAPAGDFNNDGIADLLITAVLDDPGGRSNAGSVYVVYGATNIGSTGEFDALSMDGTDGFVIHGNLPHDHCGTSVAGGGDINGDGIADIACGAEQCSAHGESLPGEAYVLFGGMGLGASGTYELSDLAGAGGADGFVMQGTGFGSLPCDDFGGAVGFLEDVNDDDYADFIVGASGVELNGENFTGAAYVVFGAPDVAGSGVIPAESLDGSNGFIMWGWQDHGSFGSWVASAGDLNDDDVPDLAVGARAQDAQGESYNGATYIIFGMSGLGSSGTINAETLDGSDGFEIAGEKYMDLSGRCVASASDVNGDGINDLIITAASQMFQDKVGRAEVVYGRSDIGGNGEFSLGTLDGTNGFHLEGYEENSLTGYHVAAGDLNDDGLSDIIIGAPDSSLGGVDWGQVFVVFGRVTPIPMTLEVDPLIAGQNATFTTTDATSSQMVYFVYSLRGYGEREVPQLNVTLALTDPVTLIDQDQADGSGLAEITVNVPSQAQGVTVYFQSLENGNISNVVSQTVE